VKSLVSPDGVSALDLAVVKLSIDSCLFAAFVHGLDLGGPDRRVVVFVMKKELYVVSGEGIRSKGDLDEPGLTNGYFPMFS
jgi:hypothetical protein